MDEDVSPGQDDSAARPDRADASRPSLSDQIYHHLRLQLISGVYAPGVRLNISKLAETFGTSVTPVREAIFQLVRENALEFRAGYQPRVPVLDMDQYIGIRETRVPVERLAARLAGPRLTEADLLTLEDLQCRFVAHEGAENWAEALATNRAFHFLIYRASDNPVLVNVIETLWLVAGPTTARQYPTFLNATANPHHHNIFVDSVRRGDYDEAAEAIVNDLRDGSFKIVSHLMGG